MRVTLFDYYLPAERIAQEPRPRGTSRLLALNRQSGAIEHRSFSDFPELLRAGDLLVRNDVKVRPARLYGRDAEGRLVEIFLLEPLAEDRRRWLALAKPGRRAKKGRTIRFREDLSVRIDEVRRDGKREAFFDREMDDRLLAEIGHVPLPPYIRRPPDSPDNPRDRAAYQTVYAKEPLAVAAPTAGLHFTEEILARAAARGIAIEDLTVAVGAGTFKPVTVEDTEAHTLDAEQVSFPARTIAAVARARQTGGRTVSVGTTVARALESLARRPEEPLAPELRFATDLFITPGFEFRAVDALLTNFHLPRSTLLMLVCAFAGRENVLRAYQEAIREGYLFYSFGDAMFAF